MAGFPKYPIPRYINSSLWILNRNWKNNLFHTVIPAFLLALIAERTLNLGFVTFFYIINECFFFNFLEYLVPGTTKRRIF